MPEFLYLTVKKVRDEGIPVTELSDARALELIRLVSVMINRITDQWFAPLKGSFKVDGRGTPFAHIDNFVPIVELDRIETGGVGDEPLIVVEDTEYAWFRDQRYAELLGQRGKFPRTPHGVVLTGIFGWLESPKDVTTDVTVVAGSGATSITVTSTVGFRVGDQVLFGNEAVPISEIPDGTTLKFDPLEFAVPLGPIRTLGRTPLEIQRAAMLMLADRRLLVPDEEESDIADRIMSESVEGYSYSLAQPKSDEKSGTESGGGANTSGNSEADDLLQGYVAPILYLGYV